jgi:hypothetical protein
MNNKCQKLFVVRAVLGAQLIFDTNVTLHSYDGGPTLVKSLKTIHLQYTIHNPTSKWACCNLSTHNVETFASINSSFNASSPQPTLTH